MISRARTFAGALFLVLIDILSFYSSLFLAYFTRKFFYVIFPQLAELSFPLSHFLQFWWMPLATLTFIAYEQLYTKRLSFWDETRELIKAVTISIVIILAIVSLGKMTEKVSRLLISFLWIFGLLMFPFFRVLGKRLLLGLGLWKENVIIMGAGRAGIEIAKGMANEKHLGYNIIGFLDDHADKIGRSITINNRDYKIFGKIKNFSKFLSLMDISTVILAMPSLSTKELSKITNNVQKYAKRVLLVPDLRGIALLNTDLQHLFMQQLFLLGINNNLKSVSNRIVKRSFDLVISLLVMPFLILTIVIIGIFIRLDSRGPVFFVQDRLGRNNKNFRCVKFRTMYENSDELLRDYLGSNDEAAEEWNKYKKLKDYDPRVTRIGKFLRETSLDELPQMFNVLKGDMSLVGPRPYLPEEAEDIKESIDIVLLTRPGITGLWQVSGRNELKFWERLKLDTWYVLNWSLWFDVVMLIKTIKVVIRREGAY